MAGTILRALPLLLLLCCAGISGGAEREGQYSALADVAAAVERYKMRRHRQLEGPGTAPPETRGGTVAERCRGRPTRVIAMSLYGDGGTNFAQGAVENARAVPSVYPGWVLRVYSSVGAEVAARLRAEGAEVVEMGEPEGILGMFWRFLAASDECVEWAVFRDTDSLINPREKAAVDAWMASGAKAHSMLDSPEHADWVMQGGMWGIRGGVIRDMGERVDAWGMWAKKLDDMHFLTYAVWPDIERDALVHSSVAGRAAGVPFPPHGEWHGHVGQQVFEPPYKPECPVRSHSPDHEILVNVSNHMLHNGRVYAHRAGESPEGSKDETFNRAHVSTHLRAALGCARWACEASPLSLLAWRQLARCLETLDRLSVVPPKRGPGDGCGATYECERRGVSALIHRLGGARAAGGPDPSPRRSAGARQEAAPSDGQWVRLANLLTNIQKEGEERGKRLVCLLSGGVGRQIEGLASCAILSIAMRRALVFEWGRGGGTDTVDVGVFRQARVEGGAGALDLVLGGAGGGGLLCRDVEGELRDQEVVRARGEGWVPIAAYNVHLIAKMPAELVGGGGWDPAVNAFVGLAATVLRPRESVLAMAREWLMVGEWKGTTVCLQVRLGRGLPEDHIFPDASFVYSFVMCGYAGLPQESRTEGGARKLQFVIAADSSDAKEAALKVIARMEGGLAAVHQQLSGLSSDLMALRPAVAEFASGVRALVLQGADDQVMRLEMWLLSRADVLVTTLGSSFPSLARAHRASRDLTPPRDFVVGREGSCLPYPNSGGPMSWGGAQFEEADCWSESKHRTLSWGTTPPPEERPPRGRPRIPEDLQT